MPIINKKSKKYKRKKGFTSYRIIQREVKSVMYVMMMQGGKQIIEAETTAAAIKKAKRYAEKYNIYSFLLFDGNLNLVFEYGKSFTFITKELQ